jgi:hypothetical protein
VPQSSAEEIAALAAADDEPDKLPDPRQVVVSAETGPPNSEQGQLALVRTLPPPPPAPKKLPEPPPQPQSESPEAAAERERAYREIFGIDEPGRRRRWRR